MSGKAGELSGNPSTAGFAGHFGKLISFDWLLFVCLLALLSLHAVVSYLGDHFDFAFIWVFGLSWGLSIMIHQLLPDDIALLVVENLFLLIVAECFALIIAFRFRKLRTLKSLPLWSCAALLVAYYFAEPEGARYILDQVRFRINQGTYLTMAKMSDGWPDYAEFDWGSTGFINWSNKYSLVLDRTGALAGGKFNPAALVEKTDTMRCEGTVHRLSGDYYSVAVRCEW